VAATGLVCGCLLMCMFLMSANSLAAVRFLCVWCMCACVGVCHPYLRLTFAVVRVLCVGARVLPSSRQTHAIVRVAVGESS
jgi:hypothetical protein